jgi:hypothetical protein
MDASLRREKLVAHLSELELEEIFRSSATRVLGRKDRLPTDARSQPPRSLLPTSQVRAWI